MGKECPACNYSPPLTKHCIGSEKVGINYFTSPTQSSVVPISQILAYLKSGDSGPYCEAHIEEATRDKLAQSTTRVTNVDFKKKRVKIGIYEFKGSHERDGSDLTPIIEKELTFGEAASLVGKLNRKR